MDNYRVASKILGDKRFTFNEKRGSEKGHLILQNIKDRNGNCSGREVEVISDYEHGRLNSSIETISADGEDVF